MKALFLFLLLANLLYAAWQLWIVPAPPPPAFVEGEGVPRLELTDEGERLASTVAPPPGRAAADADAAEPVPEPATARAQPPSADATAATADAEEPASSANGQDDDAAQPPTATLAAITAQPARCVSLGPFLNLREATEATAMLNEVGLQPSQRLAESQVWFGHWVHLPEQPSREAAIAIVENLRAQGVSDIYIEPSGEYRNWISLGVFTDAAHAETRAGQIRRLGISPQIRDRYRDSSVYWVDFALPADRDIDPGGFQSSPSRVLRLDERDCPAAAG